MNSPFHDFYEHLVWCSETRALVDPRTLWYLPRDSDIDFYFREHQKNYEFVDRRLMSHNKAKEQIDKSEKKKIAFIAHFDSKSLMLLTNHARSKGFEVIIEFNEHPSNVLR